MSILPENSPPRDDINCHDCNAACCRADMEIIMTRKEVSANKSKIKRQIVAPISDTVQTVEIRNRIDDTTSRLVLPPGREYSKLTEDCGNLTEDNMCAIYGQPSRPKSCVVFEPGSEACLYARQEAGYAD